MADTSSSPHVKSAMRTLDIIEYVIASNRSVVAQEIAGALAIPVSSLSYLLTTLVERGYLARDGRRYTVGPGLERLQLKSPTFTLTDRVTPLVNGLRTQINETVSFFVRRGWELETICTATSDHALRYAVPVGARNALHGFSAGKAILAALPDDEIDRYFKETERAPFTPATVVSEKGLRAQIAETRRTGIARTDEEHTLGVQGVGRAVVINGEVIGAFAVAIPNVRFNAEVESRVCESLIRAGELLAMAEPRK